MEHPNFIPVLSAGMHDSPKDGACVMEMVSYLAGEEWSDMPKCTDFVIARIAQRVNDILPDDKRHLVLKEFDRLFNTSKINQEFVDETCEYFEKNIIGTGYSDVGFHIHTMITYYFGHLNCKIDERTAEPEDIVQVLTDVLDIYDRTVGRDTTEKHDLNALKELTNIS